MNTLILYFSGTGNSFAAAKRLASLIDEARIQAITGLEGDISAERVLFVVPSYAYGLPTVVYKLFKTKKINANYIAVLATCGTKPGALFRQAHKLLRKQGQSLSFYGTIHSVENYFAIFKRGTPEFEQQRLIAQNDDVDRLAKMIAALETRKKPSPKPIGSMISSLFNLARPTLNRRIKISDSCIACGVCRANCQVKAIQIIDEIAVINPKICQHCQGCINVCPRHAITFGKIKTDSKRYLHPDIDINRT